MGEQLLRHLACPHRNAFGAECHFAQRDRQGPVSRRTQVPPCLLLLRPLSYLRALPLFHRGRERQRNPLRPLYPRRDDRLHPRRPQGGLFGSSRSSDFGRPCEQIWCCCHAGTCQRLRAQLERRGHLCQGCDRLRTVRPLRQLRRHVEDRVQQYPRVHPRHAVLQCEQQFAHQLEQPAQHHL